MYSNLAIYQCIRLEVGHAPPKVLEQYAAPSSQATEANARRLLKDRYYDRDFSRRNPYGLRAEGVRFLDRQGLELARYTVPRLLTERLPPGDPLQNGEAAFAKGKPRSECPYPPDSDEEASWMLGWDTAPHVVEKDA